MRPHFNSWVGRFPWRRDRLSTLVVLGFPVARLVKNPPAMRETWIQSLGWEDPLEKGNATHSSILAWRIPWTIQSMGSQRVGHDWGAFIFIFKWLYNCVSCLRETPWTTFGNQSYKYIRVKLMFIYTHIYLYDFGYVENISRETEREEGWEGVVFFCLEESIWGLSVLSLVLSCMPDTLSRVSYLFQFQNCQIYTPLVPKAFELDKNYSCGWGFTLSIAIFFLSLRIREL